MVGIEALVKEEETKRKGYDLKKADAQVGSKAREQGSSEDRRRARSKDRN